MKTKALGASKITTEMVTWMDRWQHDHQIPLEDMKTKALGASKITTEMVIWMDRWLQRRKEESSIFGLPSKRKRKASTSNRIHTAKEVLKLQMILKARRLKKAGRNKKFLASRH
ncbi:hypothetical protein Tco_0192926 [Tanacetum coccineum]